MGRSSKVPSSADFLVELETENFPYGSLIPLHPSRSLPNAPNCSQERVASGRKGRCSPRRWVAQWVQVLTSTPGFPQANVWARSYATAKPGEPRIASKLSGTAFLTVLDPSAPPVLARRVPRHQPLPRSPPSSSPASPGPTSLAMSRKPAASSVRARPLHPHRSTYARFTGVGDGIARVWGLRNVQGQSHAR